MSLTSYEEIGLSDEDATRKRVSWNLSFSHSKGKMKNGEYRSLRTDFDETEYLELFSERRPDMQNLT